MPPVSTSEAVTRFATRYVNVTDLTGNAGGVRLAAFWCLLSIRDVPSSQLTEPSLAMLSEALGRSATGSDVLAILASGLAVPPDVAAAIRGAFRMEAGLV